MAEIKKFSKVDTKLQWIPVRNLAVVWGEAQRPYKEWWAKEIADGFDPEMFDPVKTMLPNGNGIHHICEGQHRVGAVRILWGHDELVPCIVLQEADPARAADVFLNTNTNRNYVSKIDKFKVAVTAGWNVEVAIERIARHAGYRIEGSHNQNMIGAVDALKFVYGKGAKTLDRTLSIIRETFGGDPAAVNSPMLKGYGAFVCEFSEQIDWARLRDVIAKKYTPGQLINEAKVLKELSKEMTITMATSQVLRKAYNRGLSATRQLKRKGD